MENKNRKNFREDIAIYLIIQYFKNKSNGINIMQVGISFKNQHYQDILDQKPDVDFFEIHSENFMAPGGLSNAQLKSIREHYAITMHGVSLSLGSDEPLCKQHLQELKTLKDWLDPMIVSEHVSWSMMDGAFLNDLLPIPYSKHSLQVLVDHIKEFQEVMECQILIENPSTYLSFKRNEMSEPEFLSDVCEQTGCGILLDVNNIYVSGHNNCLDTHHYIDQINPGFVHQMHLAGHNRKTDVYIDDHGSKVSDEVWDLYRYAISKLGPKTTLVEWDSNVPNLDVFVDEAHKARDIMKVHREKNDATVNSAA